MRAKAHIIFIVALVVLGSLKVTAQQDHTKAQHDSLVKAAYAKLQQLRPESSPVFKAVKGSPGSYENNGRYHGSSIYLYPDSTFAYYSVFEGGCHLALGNYKTSGLNRLVLNWDQQKTEQAVKDKAVYGKYYKYCSPRSHPVINDAYMMYADSLVRQK